LFGITPLAIQQRCDVAFDVEAVTKDFFREIANWYFWALKHVRFPKDAPKEADGHDHISVIRLITRLIFCWFVKEKGLIPDTLFDERKLAQTLTGFEPAKTSDKESVFYKAILQNLFFATLNTEMDERGWTKEEQNFMAHSLYRYREFFSEPKSALDLFKEIPFLNGGLFECLDKDLGENAKPRYMRIDGFSGRDDSQPIVPDFLFFGGEREVDLSAEYGDAKYKRVPVRGLIHIFNRYNFTVEEDTPVDQEVALDPELSGKVFENLLAAYNPETGATARKQTGSFYTPREIVNYMVDEALIACLKTKLETALPSAKDVEARLRHLFAYNDEPHKFTAPEVDALIAAIDSLKSLDPAVGSGAFPMGILHKLVFILGKLDPRNEKWKERQIVRVRDTMATAEKIEDATARERAVRELEQQITGINEAFEHNELDYGRKLYLIENCIYGVDIQAIAVQIAKMRFFISLIVDQKIDDTQPNRGVRPLPNLETKFVAANTLLGVNRPGQQLLRNRDIDTKEGELRRVRERYFLARTPKQKATCRDEDARLRVEIAELLKADGWDTATACRLASWNPYDQNASADFFDVKWMFGIVEGFDLAIGNPPYVRVHKQDAAQKQLLRLLYKSPVGDFDIYIVFIEKSLLILRQHGFLSFITPDKFLIRDYGREIRKIILKNRIVEFYDISRADDAFGAAVYPLIQLIQKSPPSSQTRIRFARSVKDMNSPQNEYLRPQTDWQKSNMIELIEESDLKILKKITTGSKTLAELIGSDAIFCGTPRARDYYEWAEGLVAKRTARTPKVLVCSNLTPFCIDHSKEIRTLGERVRSPYFDNSGKLIGDNQWSSFLHVPKVLIRGNDTRLTAVLDEEPSVFIGVYGIKLTQSNVRIAKYLVAALNSTLCQWVFLKKNPSLKIGGGFFSINAPQLLSLPFKEPPDANLNMINGLFDQIVARKKRDPQADTTALEHEIDRQVYALHGLTPEEITTVEQDAK
jgi:adenine-specific DNA-methyltransferase